MRGAASAESLGKKGASQALIMNCGPGATVLARAGVSLFEMQCRLDNCGASDLIVDLIMAQPNHRVFLEVLELAIALLEGGNYVIQVVECTTLTPCRNTTMLVHQTWMATIRQLFELHRLLC